MRRRFLPLFLGLLMAPVLFAQKLVEPRTPPASSFHDSRSGVTFQVPAGWNLSHKDGEISTYAQDVRSTLKASQVRAVTSINFNPFPASTFSGAYVYLSFEPHAIQADCDHQAMSPGKAHPASTAKIGGVTFNHGYDEHGGICVESRDEIYAAMHNSACYRFDLVINSFCGGDVSGVRDISDKELASVRQRLESILSTVQFDKK